MGLVISRANSMHFVKVNTDLPNIENTLSFNEQYAAFATREYCQKWKSDDVVTVQITSDVATSPSVQILAPYEHSTISPTLKSSYTDRYFWEFDVDFADYSGLIIQIKVTQLTDVWLSEYQSNDDLTDDLEAGFLLKCEYTNKDQPSALPNYQVDFTTDIDFFFYVEAIIKEFAYSGEDEVYTNVDEKKLVSAQSFKTRMLKTSELPEFMCDKIELAGKHFVFLLNDLRYTAEGVPDVATSGDNLASLEWLLTHNEILGLSTNDKGIIVQDMDDLLIIRSSDAISGTWSFTLPDGYLLHVAACGHGSGSAASYTPKIGTTVGGDELWASGITTVALGAIEEISLHEQQAFEGGSDQTIYITLTGAGAVGKIYCQLSKNYDS